MGTILATPRFKIDKVVLEKIQHRATKLIAGMVNKTYSEWLRELNLPSLVYWQKCGDMIQAHKLLSTNQENELLEIDPSHITQGNPKRIHKLHARTGARCSFFLNQIVNLLNNLKENTVSAESTDVFKCHLDAEWIEKPWRFDRDAPESSTESNQPRMQLSSQGVIQQDQKSLFHSKLWFKVIKGNHARPHTVNPQFIGQFWLRSFRSFTLAVSTKIMTQHENKNKLLVVWIGSKYLWRRYFKSGWEV